MDRDAHETNRRSWNAATVVHNAQKGDQAAFLREGGSTLYPEDVELLGPVRARSVLHLQCNSGQDTLSIAALGARVVGVDISDEAIAFARRLSEESGIPGNFHRSDIYPWLETASERFQVVYSSYGAIPWLSDLDAWARGIARVLRPGGHLALLEFHPAAWMLDSPDWRPAYPYSTHGRPLVGPGVGDYVGASEGALFSEEGKGEGFENPNPCVEFIWGIGEVVMALIGAGMTLERLEEYPWSNGCKMLPNMRREGRRWYPPEGVPEVPLMYGIVARR